jgi:hypothetical protein
VVADESILGKYFRRPPPDRRKYPGHVFSSATTEADENSQPTNYFRRPWESR